MKSALCRAKYGDSRLGLIKPESHPERAWQIEMGTEGIARGNWVKSVVMGTVLDVGCGNGYMALDMASTTEHVHAVDVSGKFLTRTADLMRLNGVMNVTLSRADAYALPFDDGSFDVVALLEILEHMERPQDVVSEALRVARRRVVVTVPAHGELTHVGSHIYDFSPDDLKALFPGAPRMRKYDPWVFLYYDLRGSA